MRFDKLTANGIYCSQRPAERLVLQRLLQFIEGWYSSQAP
jgi:hypothetical protein